MNKKQIYILSLLISLMFVIVCMQQLFRNDIRKVAFRNNGVKNFHQYKINEGKYNILLPGEWLVEEEENIDGEKLEVRFNSNKIEGTINIISSLDNINEVDSKLLRNASNKKYYEYESDSELWKVIDYQVKENNNTFRNKCYFRKSSEGKVILINFKYVDKKNKPSMEVVFEEIINSIP
ncbi:MAG: hypothetical protein ACRDA5_13360 [Clostridium sp.]